MAVVVPDADAELPAGGFAEWLGTMQAALRGERPSDVPCGTCTACCTASQFVHIEPDETATLARIPASLLFPAPRLPAGHMLLGYDEQGRCPMLGDDGCSIYAERPRTCRTYDCRIFPAAGLEPDPAKPRIVERARRWRFDHETDRDRAGRQAVQAAAEFIEAHGSELFPGGAGPSAPDHVAVLAVEIHGAFLREDPGTGTSRPAEPDVDAVRVAIRRRRE